MRGLLLAALWAAGAAFAQDWPARPLHLIVPYAPGGPVDLSARLMLDWVDRLNDLILKRNNFERPEQKEEVLQLVRRAREYYARYSL